MNADTNNNPRASFQLPAWIQRLKFLTAHPRTPLNIKADVAMALAEIARLAEENAKLFRFKVDIMELMQMAKQHEGRADDCGRLARALIEAIEVAR